MSRWWERYPDVFAAEKVALDQLGYSWDILDIAWQSGHLVLDVSVPGPDGDRMLRAHFPDSYPYFPPEVYLLGVTLSRHQQPFGKNLCLLASGGEQWRPGQDTLGVLLSEQLPLLDQVVSPQQTEEFIRNNEDHLGEPLSSFLPYPPNCSIIVPDETPSPEFHSGRLKVLVRSNDLETSLTEVCVNGVLTVIADHAARPHVEFKTVVPEFSESRGGYWMRLPERPALPNIDAGEDARKHFIDMMLAKVPAFKKAFEAGGRGQVFVCGFIYPDEVSWRKSSDDWFFIALKIVRERKGARPATGKTAFVKADWGGEKSWLCRAPALGPLREKSVLIVGVGSLGSPLVLQLARAGVRTIHLVDFDQLQVGNTVRWALGWKHAGIAKVETLASYVVEEYPYTTAVAHQIRIGEPGSSDYDLISKIAGEVDLVVDGSASLRVNHFLADQARELHKPYLWVTTTHGAAGGIVGRVLSQPGKGGCYQCFLHALGDGTINLPEDSGTAKIQPGGCAQATFIGAGLDSDEIALMGARLAVATLTGGMDPGYRDFDWDVAVADLYKDGNPIVPTWATYRLSVHGQCLACVNT